ncbi:MFS general substrate transporter [Peniophora sp. CONT]|nr:MFS general substrate transporter [Peniophora sp. CONT]
MSAEALPLLRTSLDESVPAVLRLPAGSGYDSYVDPAELEAARASRLTLERKLVRKLDIRMSILVIIYILNYIDRNNASAARLQGFEEDLHLHGEQFYTLLSILYVGYILMQVPSNMLLNWMGRPSLYLPICMAIWGVLSVLTGLTTNFTGALITRFCLGFVEASFFPGAIFLLSKWYTRSEIGVRMAFFYCGSISSNAFGALLASGILKGMRGAMGRAAWRWLFFIEGGATIVVAIMAIFILPDFPETDRHLTSEERALAIRRLDEDAGLHKTPSLEEDEGNGHGFWLAVHDWKVWLLAVTLASFVIALSFNAFFPTLAETLGYGTTVSLLLCAPPFLFAAVVAFFLNKHSDEAGERYWHLTCSLAFGIFGYIIAASTLNTVARYISLFFMAQSYAGLVCYMAWVSSVFAHPPAKRAVAIALINAVSQLGNVAGSYIWPKEWGPSYRYSYAICIVCQGTTIIALSFFRAHLARENVRARKEEIENGAGRQGFRYML